MNLQKEFCALNKALISLIGDEKEKPLSWQQLMQLRVHANDLVSQQVSDHLSKYEEKICMKELFSSLGVPSTKIIFQSRTDCCASSLSALLKQPRSAILVIKPSHLTTGNGVYFLHPDGRVTLPPPVGPGKDEMAKHQKDVCKKSLRYSQGWKMCAFS